MHAVLGLLELDGGRGLEYLLGHFHRFQPKLLIDLFTNDRVAIVKGWQTVQEDGLGTTAELHHPLGHLVGLQELDALAERRLASAEEVLEQVLVATDVALCPYRSMSASGALATLISAGRPIVTGRHCFGCTAGAGSSCTGALTAETPV